MTIALRRATLDDAERLAQGLIDGFEHYRGYAPEGWEPPTLAHETANVRRRLPDERMWCVVAEDGDELVGQVSFLPAAISGRPVDEPHLAHLSNLFVREDRWGTGLARELHDMARDEAAARGFTEMRLVTPEGQARARRFYEREGWRAVGEAFFEPALGLEIIEYRCALRAGRPSPPGASR